MNRSNEARLEIAGQLAERFGAQVIGITAAEFSPPPYFTDGEQTQKVLDQGRAAIRNRLAEAEAQFRLAMRSRASVVEWRVRRIFQGDLSSSRLALPTLLLWEGGGRDALGDPFMQADPGDLLMQTGRPLLVVPETSNWLDLRNVLIA